MATFDDITNFAYALVVTAPSPATSGVTIVVQPQGGAVFPTPPYNCTVWITGLGPLNNVAEIVRVTAQSLNTPSAGLVTMTIARAQETTTARTIVAGDQFARTFTKKEMVDMQNAINAVTGGGLATPVAMPTATSDAGAAGEYSADANKLAVYVAGTGWMFFQGFQI